ncbi:MAG: hypothetical protein Q4D38_02345 [Planctomycetia bacterium]|nr:hypothetical protein [Planctomycetia bacterium]
MDEQVENSQDALQSDPPRSISRLARVALCIFAAYGYLGWCSLGGLLACFHILFTLISWNEATTLDKTLLIPVFVITITPGLIWVLIAFFSGRRMSHLLENGIFAPTRLVSAENSGFGFGGVAAMRPIFRIHLSYSVGSREFRFEYLSTAVPRKISRMFCDPKKPREAMLLERLPFVLRQDSTGQIVASRWRLALLTLPFCLVLFAIPFVVQVVFL